MLIIDMKMPKNCCECDLRQDDFDRGEQYCPFTGIECLSIGRQAKCPIKVELVTCGECRYPLKKETPVGTVKYDCVLHKGWYDADHYCGHGERHGERKDGEV